MAWETSFWHSGRHSAQVGLEQALINLVGKLIDTGIVAYLRKAA